ncbi:MAG: hypothetical protein ABI718_18225, partial [Acidobacteriota bacterium]
MPELTFGRRAVGRSPSDLLAAEEQYPLAARLLRVDAITTDILIRSLSGNRVADTKAVAKAVAKNVELSIPTLPPADRALVAEIFTLAAQQERGAWFLSEAEKLRVGLANLPHYCSRYPRFAIGIAWEETVRVDFSTSPEGLYFWSVVEPLFAVLFRPLMLRGPGPATGDAAAQKQVWLEVEESYLALGFDLAALAPIRYGGEWGRLSSSAQLQVRAALIEECRKQAPMNLAGRFRAWRAQPLIERYYAKANRGQPQMRETLTKPLQRFLV